MFDVPVLEVSAKLRHGLGQIAGTVAAITLRRWVEAAL
jgi:hypothetical protein